MFVRNTYSLLLVSTRLLSSLLVPKRDTTTLTSSASEENILYINIPANLCELCINEKMMTKTYLENRSAMALFFPLPLSDSSFAVTRRDCVAQERRLNPPLSIFHFYTNA